DRQLPFTITTLAAALAAMPLPSHATYTASCRSEGDVLNCTLSGEYSNPIEDSWPAIPVPHVVYSTTADINIYANQSTATGLPVLAPGGNGNGSHPTGGDTQGIVFTNTGNITLQNANSQGIDGDFYGLNVQQQGGDALSHDHSGDNGGVAGRDLDQIVSLTNQGAINLNLPYSKVLNGNGAALSAISKGGKGAPGTNGNGGAGGQSVG